MTAGYWEEVPMHFRAAITNGLTREEIREVILQVGLYRRVPVANHATLLLQESFSHESGRLPALKLDLQQ